MLAALLVVGTMLGLALSLQRAFQVDEVEHVHATYALRDGRVLYRNLWEGHHPLIYGLLAPLVDPDDAVGSFRRSRIVPFAVLLATVGVGALVASRLAGREAGWLAACLIGTHSTMVERGIEVRPDGLLGLASVAALAFELSRLPGRQRSNLSALTLGLAFLATQKAAFLCLGFAVLWAYRAWRCGSARRLIEPALVGCAPFAAMVVWLSANGALAGYWRVNLGDAALRAARQLPGGGEFSPAVYLVHEGAFNLFFAALALTALLVSLARAASKRLDGGEAVVAGVAWIQFISLWLNPFPFPYLHVTVVPVLAVLGAFLFSRLVQRLDPLGSPRRWIAAALVAVLAAATSMPRLASRLKSSPEPQMEVLAEIQRITDPSDTVFDLVGLYFRRDAYPVWVMTGAMMGRYYSGSYPRMVPALTASAPAVVVLNYRTNALKGEERRFLLEHYVHHDGPIYVQGTAIESLGVGETLEFSVLQRNRFRWDGTAGLLVDGVPFIEGELSAGRHVASTDVSLANGRLVLARATRSGPARPPFELYPAFD